MGNFLCPLGESHYTFTSANLSQTFKSRKLITFQAIEWKVALYIVL